MFPLGDLARFGVDGPTRIECGPERIPALLVRPVTSLPCPAVVLQHGLGATKADLLPLGALLASQGMIALLPDAWGHGERESRGWDRTQSADSAGVLLEIVRHTCGDLAEVLTTVAALPSVRRDSLFLAGFSMGAVCALIVAMEDARVTGVASIAGSPLSDLLDSPLVAASALRPEDQSWARSHDVTTLVSQFAPKPLLLQHGRQDDMVPVGGSIRLYKTAQPYYANAPENLSLMLYDHTHLVSQGQIEDALRWMVGHIDLPEPGASAH